MMITKRTFEDMIDCAVHTDCGTVFFSVGEVEYGDEYRDVCLVLGWTKGYEEGEKYQEIECGNLYTLCGKIAFNTDDLQCDYDWDWSMPVFADGDVMDTEIAISGVEDYESFVKNAEYVIEKMNSGELFIP